MSLSRKLFGASASIAAAGLVARSLAIVSAPILTLLLGPEPYGVMALLTTLISLGATFAMLGSDLSYTRFACTGKSEEDAAVEAFCWRFIIVSSASIALAIFAFWGLSRVGIGLDIGFPSAMLLVVGGCVFVSVLDTMAQARRRIQGAYSRLAVTLIVSAILSTGATLLLAYYWRQDAWSMLLGYAVGPAASFALLGLPALTRLIRASGLDKSKRIELINFGFMGAAISAPLYWVVSTADRWFISAYLDTRTVGIYAFSCSIAYMGQILNNAFLVAWRTESFKSFEVDPQGAPQVLGALWGQFVVMLALVWLMITAAGGDVIRLLASPEFHEGTVFVPWLAGAVFLYGVSHMGSTGLLIGKTMRVWTYWWIFAALASVALNLVFVRLLGALGAAVVQALSFAIIAIGVTWAAQKAYPLTINFRQLFIAIPVILLIGALMGPSWNISPIISIAYKLPVGIVTTVLILYWVCPNWFEHGMSVLKRIVRI